MVKQSDLGKWVKNPHYHCKVAFPARGLGQPNSLTNFDLLTQKPALISPFALTIYT